jgi:hypothetical protein
MSQAGNLPSHIMNYERALRGHKLQLFLVFSLFKIRKDWLSKEVGVHPTCIDCLLYKHRILQIRPLNLEGVK